MHVEVHDENTLHAQRAAGIAGGNREVVEDAESRAKVGKGMVSATGAAGSEAMLQRQFHGQERAAEGRTGTLDEGRTPREADTSHGTLVYRAVAIAVYIGWRMRQLYQLARGRLRAVKLIQRGKAIADQMLVDFAELGHGETMARWQIRNKIRVKDQRQRHASNHNPSMVESQDVQGATIG